MECRFIASCCLVLAAVSCRTPPGGEPVPALAPGEQVWFQDVAWSPDGRWLCASRGVRAPSGEWRVEPLVVASRGGPPARPRTGLDNGIWMSWSPAGARVVFAAAAAGADHRDIWVARADGSGAARLTDHPASDSAPTFSADGRHVAFMSDRDGAHRVWVVGLDGRGLRRLGGGEQRDEHPRWSPDGAWIAYHGGQAAGADGVYVMRPDGSGRRRVAERGVFPTWLPSGDALAYAGDGGVFVVGLDGSAPELRIPGASYAAWSPDGRRVAYVLSAGGLTGVYVRPARGSGEPRRLLAGPGPPW